MIKKEEHYRFWNLRNANNNNVMGLGKKKVEVEQEKLQEQLESPSEPIAAAAMNKSTRSDLHLKTSIPWAAGEQVTVATQKLMRPENSPTAQNTPIS